MSKNAKKERARIESVLNQFSERLDRIEAQLGIENPSFPPKGLLGFLDAFRAGEALGEASLGAWISVCQDPALRGGLRTVQLREGTHARLLEQRIKELGASPRAEIPEADYELAMKQAASCDMSDADKVRDFVARFPDPDAAIQPILDFAAGLDGDPESQSLLRNIAQDERATVAFFVQACEALAD